MTNQEEIQDKGLQRMRSVRLTITFISVAIIIGVPWLGMVFENDVFISYINSKFFLVKSLGCLYVVKITTALIQNHIAKKRGWSTPYGSFWEFF